MAKGFFCGHGDSSILVYMRQSCHSFYTNAVSQQIPMVILIKSVRF
jgi:hypothetical protein